MAIKLPARGVQIFSNVAREPKRVVHHCLRELCFLIAKRLAERQRFTKLPKANL